MTAPIVPPPTACPRCGGERRVLVSLYDGTLETYCPDCRCPSCGADSVGLCEPCDGLAFVAADTAHRRAVDR